MSTVTGILDTVFLPRGQLCIGLEKMAPQRLQPRRQAAQHLLTKIDTPALHQLLLVLAKQRSEMLPTFANGKTRPLSLGGQFPTAQEATPIPMVGDSTPGHAARMKLPALALVDLGPQPERMGT